MAEDSITTEAPELRIIDQELWDAVQQSARTNSRLLHEGFGRPGQRTRHRWRRNTVPVQQAPQVRAVRLGDGRVWRLFDGVLPLRRPCEARDVQEFAWVREDVLRERLLEELRHTLARPAGLAFARKCISRSSPSRSHP